VKKYKIINKYRFYECLMGIILLIIMIAIGLIRFNFGVATAEADNIDTISKIPELQNSVQINVIKTEYERLQKETEEQREEINNVLEEVKQQKIKTTEHKDLGEFIISFYDLSPQSCGKLPSHKAYGISRSGFDLRGHTYKTARAIAVDTKVIPLGSKVYIEFIDEEYLFLNGIYRAVDTGNAIRNKKIDLYYGENETEKCMELGLTKAKVVLLKSNKK